MLTETPIDISLYPGRFKYKIYEGYRPETLAQTRDYLKFLIQRKTQKDLEESEIPPHLLAYLQKEIKTTFPAYINEKHILNFDQNFECGNLDSAYVHNEQEYNLLMKVDTNTKGYTYWFMFKVKNFRIGMRYTFNILNFTRSVDKFYKDKMNILTKRESLHFPTKPS